MMATWVDRDHALELRTEGMTLLVSDNGGGRVRIVVSPTRADVALAEPAVELRPDGFVVDFEARVPAGAVR